MSEQDYQAEAGTERKPEYYDGTERRDYVLILLQILVGAEIGVVLVALVYALSRFIL